MSSIDTVWIGDQPLVQLVLDASEAAILAEIADQFVQLLTDSPTDPAATGLFPAGYADPAAQAEFARFTHVELSERKVAAAQTVRDALRIPAAAPDAVVVELEPNAAWNWLTFFTDIRLVLAERLRASEGAEEHDLQQGVYDWTAYLQGALVDELSALLEAPGSLGIG